jgi:hypothetical protein
MNVYGLMHFMLSFLLILSFFTLLLLYPMTYLRLPLLVHS